MGHTDTNIHNVEEAQCYVVDIRRTDGEQTRGRLNNNWCSMFQSHRPLSTAYKAKGTAVHVRPVKIQQTLANGAIILCDCVWVCDWLKVTKYKVGDK